MQGHWLLAKLGKRVLRPGGIELTRRLLKAVDIHPGQRIVELGPGVGRTAEILLRSSPASYRAVDPNPEGREQVAAVLAGHPRADYVVADAADTGLPTGEADLVVGEAMLTMQSEEGKRAIVAEAARLLAPGGRYAIHELALRADRGEEEREAARKRLSRIIKVGARRGGVARPPDRGRAGGRVDRDGPDAPARAPPPHRRRGDRRDPPLLARRAAHARGPGPRQGDAGDFPGTGRAAERRRHRRAQARFRLRADRAHHAGPATPAQPRRPHHAGPARSIHPSTYPAANPRP